MLKVGMIESCKKVVTFKDIQNFGRATGDFNPIHFDEEYARQSIYGRRIAHGMLSAGYISSMLGTTLPGAGTIYLHQDLNFKKPVYIGDEITTTVEVVKIVNEKKNIYELSTKCENQFGDIVVDGFAVVKSDNGGEKIKMEEVNNISSFYTEEELKSLGLKSYGKNVLISRNAMIYSPEKLEVGNDVRIDDFCVISGNIKLGSYIHIAQFCGIYGGDAGVVMEDYSGLSSKVTIYATSNDYSGESMTNPMVPAKYKPGDKEAQVKLGKHVICGVNAVILPGVVVGEGCAIGALSLVAKNLDPWGIYVGAPAKRIKERSKKLLELEAEFKLEQEK